MTTNKYGNLLTIILIVLIVGIFIGAGLLVYNYAIKPKKDDKQKIAAIEEFDREVEENNSNNNSTEPEETGELPELEGPSGPSGSGSQQGTVKKSYFKGYVMLGYITIPKTNVKEPIFNQPCVP